MPEDVIAEEWQDIFLTQIRARLIGTNKLPVAFCIIAVDPETKNLNITADILGDKSGPMPESDRTAILRVFARFEEDIKKIFGVIDFNPVKAWSGAFSNKNEQ